MALHRTRKHEGAILHAKCCAQAATLRCFRCPRRVSETCMRLVLPWTQTDCQILCAANEIYCGVVANILSFIGGPFTPFVRPPTEALKTQFRDLIIFVTHLYKRHYVQILTIYLILWLNFDFQFKPF